MLSKILGTLWVLFGLWWLIKPESLKNRLRKKMNRRIRLFVLLFMFVFAMLILGSIFQAKDLFARLIGAAGLVITIQIIKVITQKTSDKLSDFVEGRSIVFFRIGALLILIMGILFLLA